MHYVFKSKSTTGLLVVEVFFVGAATVVANLFVPAAGERILLTRLLAVALLVGAPSGVFVDQDSFNKPHGVSFSDWSQYSRTHQANLCAGY